MIFVRHGRAVVQPDTPTDQWPLDPAYLDDIIVLRSAVTDLPVVCSDMRRAVETPCCSTTPTIRARAARSLVSRR